MITPFSLRSGRKIRTRATRLAAWLAPWLLIVSCQEPTPTPGAGSNSNWLTPCSKSQSCATATACECGACSRVCSNDTDCEGLADARCVPSGDPSVLTQCGNGARQTGMCLPACSPGGCGEGRACVAGACVLIDLPAGAFCDPLRASTHEARRDEDELLEAFQALRQAGGVTCTSGGPASLPASPVRLDPRLVCAARALAADIDVTRSRSLIDSEGRDTTDRLILVGYTRSTWAESLALNPESASDALSLMLQSTSSCEGLTAAATRDIGVGSVGSARVITLAAP